ncbi:MAG: lipocalin family protein [Flavobacteriales bacterium]
MGRAVSSKQDHSDESVHLKSPMEWWQLSGVLREEGGDRKFGLEYVFFHAYSKEDSSHAFQSHIALIDPKKQLYLNDYQSVVIPDSVAVINDRRPLNLKVKKGSETWKLKGEAGWFSLGATMSDHPGYGFRLSTEAIRKKHLYSFPSSEVLQGVHYFSYPSLHVSGILHLQEEKVKVEGELWYDRIWNASILVRKEVRWNWLSIRLNKQNKLLIFSVSTEKNAQREIYGTFFPDTGIAMEIEPDKIQMTETSWWVSSVSKKKYADGWKINIPVLELEVQVDAVVPQQEFRAHLLSYWAGLCDVKGRFGGEDVLGNAYVEIKK